MSIILYVHKEILERSKVDFGIIIIIDKHELDHNNGQRNDAT
jgi:hypothetical protein